MNHRTVVSFGKRLGVALLVLGVLYAVFVFLPKKQAKQEDELTSQQKNLASLLEEVQLQRQELILYDPGNPSIYGDIANYIESSKLTVAKLEEQNSFVTQQYPGQLESFKKLTTDARVVWLELSAFYDFVDVLFAYNPSEDLLTDGSVTKDELIQRANGADTALTAFIADKKYQADNQFQLSDGSVVAVDGVTSFTLSEDTKMALQAASTCLNAFTPSANSSRCTSEMTEVKRQLLTELNNILLSENGRRVDTLSSDLLQQIN